MSTILLDFIVWAINKDPLAIRSYRPTRKCVICTTYSAESRAIYTYRFLNNTWLHYLYSNVIPSTVLNLNNQ